MITKYHRLKFSDWSWLHYHRALVIPKELMKWSSIAQGKLALTRHELQEIVVLTSKPITQLGLILASKTDHLFSSFCIGYALTRTLREKRDSIFALFICWDQLIFARFLPTVSVRDYLAFDSKPILLTSIKNNIVRKKQEHLAILSWKIAKMRIVYLSPNIHDSMIVFRLWF